MINMDVNNINNLITDKTKKICLCSVLSMILIILFILSPLSNLFVTSILMKLIAILILAYTIYLNTNQSFTLQNMDKDNKTKEYLSQLNINIICSYIFTIFLTLLLFYTLKSFF
jgi:uncharacterized membrane protein YidH (DUF202 family)